MAEKIKSNENAKTNETKTTTKKIATGNTKKALQKRSSSVAGKAKTTTKKVGENKSASTKKSKVKEDVEKIEKVKSPKKQVSKKSEIKPEKEELKEKIINKEETVEKVKEIKPDKIVKEKSKVEKNNSTKKEDKKAQKESIKKEKTKKVKKNINEEKTEIEEGKELQKTETVELQEAVAKEIKEHKKISDVELNKINTKIFQNICLAVVIMFYFNFIILGFINIENSIFVTDLKVFGIAILLIAIGVFEYSYKKESSRHTIHGIELLILAFVTMAFIYIDLMFADKLIYMAVFVTYLFAIYYVIKSIIIYNRMKKEYFMNEMKKIIKKVK